MVLAAVAEVGLAMSVVGAVTGNKTLTKIGGVLGLVGGVGGMLASAASSTASGASMAATGAETLESAAGLADAAYGGAAGMEASQLAGIESMTSELASSASNFLGEGAKSGLNSWDALVSDAQQAAFGTAEQAAVAPTATQTDALIGVNEPMSATKDVYGNLNPTVSSTPARESLAPKVQDLIGESGVNGSDAMSNAYTDAGGKGPGGFGSTGAMDQKNWFADVMGWAKKNEKLATSVMTLASGGLSGMGQMKQAEMAQEANRMRYGYGNQVASYGRPRPLIGAQ